jgi:pSer/pThr/pTyr-binding forkhead associated (FHA) protein
MAKLVLSSGGSIIHQCFLDRERVKVGRAPHNQIVIYDPAVSDEHAAIITVGNDHILEHPSKLVDTLVNGSPASRHILQHGDTMQFGAFYLRYLNPRASADSDLDRTMLISGLARVHNGPRESAPAAKAGHVRSAHTAGVRFPKGKVKVIAGSRNSGTIRLDRVVATFGKPGKELAVVTRRPRGYFITHVEGRRSARVNGQSIGGKESRLLRHGDIIEVAEEKLEFLLD